MCVVSLTAAAVTLGTIAADAAIVGTIASVGFQIAGNQAQAKAAEAQGGYEAQIAEYEATLEQQRGDVDQVRYGINARREHAKLINRQSGYSQAIDFGNQANLAAEHLAFQAFDSDILARTTQARVLGLNLRAEGSRSAARNIRSAMTFANVGVAFGGVAGIGGTFASMYSRGVFDGPPPSERKASKYSGGGSSSSGRAGFGGRVRDAYRRRRGVN